MALSGYAANNQIVKAGWMQRLSDVLKRWKPTYCVLKTNGLLSYYNSENLMEVAQGHINLPRDTFNLKVGQNVTGITPPHGMSVLSLVDIRTSQAAYIFCAESPDDAQMWKLVFDDVIRANRASRSTPAPQTPVPQPPVMMAGTPAPPPPYTPIAAGPIPAQAPAPPPPTYVMAPPQPIVAPSPSPVTVITPGSSSRVTSTTYYQNGQSVTTVQRPGRNRCISTYPVQQTVYSYPGQTVITPGAGGTVTYQVPNQTQTTTTVYRYY